MEFVLERGTHKVVAVVDDQRDARLVLLVNPPRILWRNNYSALDLAVANVFHCSLLIVVVDRHKCAHVGVDGIKRFADLEGLSAAVLVDEAEARVTNFAAEGVA